MAENPNLAVMRRLYEALTSRDVDALREMLVECVYHVPGESAISGVYKGGDEVLGLFLRTTELTGGTIAFEVHDLIAGEDHIMALDRATARRGDRTLDTRRILVGHIRNGLVQDIWVLVEDQYVFDEFWS